MKVRELRDFLAAVADDVKVVVYSDRYGRSGLEPADTVTLERLELYPTNDDPPRNEMVVYIR